ncbi:hypothetical protein CYMTET_48313 [Cymbomonas tetramitiformis]|uniref:Uncharacterized protein n=1 Tax=Cymbomonas tetramitiformis TaxID=36881 RepID=A0AAE0EVA2_9CHLO|nr:hypothetical protein CYMTET_48313 [Cymbomonas tetramitiformis]
MSDGAGEPSDLSGFLEEFARIVGDASTLLASLRHDEREVARDTPPPRGDFSRRHGGGGVKFPPSKWRDERNRRTDGGFGIPRTAFDDENDEEFARLCHRHDQPLVRDDPEPFTYPVEHDVGLRAHYAGLGRGAADAGVEDVLSDARGGLDSLRSAAAAAQVGGATTASVRPTLHLGTLSAPQVVCDAPPPANHEIDTGLYPVLASDPASAESPFEEPLRVTFMDQRARISAVASALHVIRRRELTHGYGLVVSGGAHAPVTKIESINHIVNMSFDHRELTPQHPPLFPPPCVPLGHCLVVFGGVASLISPLFLSTFALVCGRVEPHRIFHLCPPRGVHVPALAMLVPHIVAPHRVGVG